MARQLPSAAADASVSADDRERLVGCLGALQLRQALSISLADGPAPQTLPRPWQAGQHHAGRTGNTLQLPLQEVHPSGSYAVVRCAGEGL